MKASSNRRNPVKLTGPTKIVKTLLVLPAALLLAAGVLAMPPNAEAAAATILSLQDCIDIAVLNHPSIAGAESAIATQEGRVDQSVVGDRLTVSGSASTSRAGTRDGDNASYSVGATTSVKLFDANRSKYSVGAAVRTLEATKEDARQTLQDVRSNVKTAYMNLLMNMETADQRRQSAEAFERHLEQARGFYEAGSNPWYDVTKAEVDLGNAQLSLVEARSNVETAMAALHNAMGVSQEEAFEVEPARLFIADRVEAEAEGLALKHRADYRSAEFKTLAGQSTISAEARTSSPTITLEGGYSGSGDDLFDLGRGWNIGVRMSVPIVDGGESKARLDIAKGQLGSLEAAREKLRQDILLDVKKAKTDLTNARERIRISELTLANAEENRRLAVGRYETGVGDPLEVTDALVSLTEAQLSKFQAHYDLQIAIIGMEQAIGMDMTELSPADGENDSEKK